MSTSSEAFQLSSQAAETYESTFVPALFAEWATQLVAAADVRPGQRVVDIACGTGVVARAAADRLRASGTVVGLDVNEAMLSVARRLRPDIHWQYGDASSLPFEDCSFDVVLCQAALMFFPDRQQALREMARVTTDDGVVALHVWAGLDAQPAYSRVVDVAARHAGPEATDLLSAYWVLGDLDDLRLLCRAAGLRTAQAETRTGTARFASIDALVRAEVESTPLIDRIDDDVYDRILTECRAALGEYTIGDGTVQVPITGHIIIARK